MTLSTDAPTPARARAPSFLSPEPAAATARELLQRTLSEGARKKRKLPTIDDGAKRKKKLPLQLIETPTQHPLGKENEVNRASTNNGIDSGETATRRLEFAAASTPRKSDKKQPLVKKAAPELSSSSSSSSEEEEDDHSSASSDECEVAFDAMTLGNLRIIREAVPSPSSPVSTASASSSSLKPIGLEYKFAVGSQVSSIAVAPNGTFLVVGFYNGNVLLFPLTQDSLRYRHGVLLYHIAPRGLITQLMVRVALPADGKFIFAGVYRGSTEIRAFEVDSVELPSVERLAQSAAARGGDADHEDDSGGASSDDDEESSGFPMARAVSHSYSDAKLKGFSDVKSVVRKSTNNTTEYHLLCGLGIKNIHLWRFYRDESASEWAWQCIFDKQNNGISIEMLCFHRDVDYQFISKSEHQNIRIWNLEEHDATGGLSKKSLVDVKNTVDVTAVYGDYAYGGSEALALIDLRSSSRMELDLPLSAKEQAAKEASMRSNAGTRITASLRGRRSARGRGSADDGNSGQRIMRMVYQVAGQDAAPFVVGMCTDGSVFMHRPQPETMGLATPLEFVEGYEDYFHDPSLNFQIQFSDLTRVNTNGLLAVLPLPTTEKEEWMVVAANANQLLVRSMDAFLHRNDQMHEQSTVQQGLRRALRDMGRNASGPESDDSDGNSSSSSDDEPIQLKPAPRATTEIKRDKQIKSQRRKGEAGEKSRKLAKSKTEKADNIEPSATMPALQAVDKALSAKPELPTKLKSEKNALPLAPIQARTTNNYTTEGALVSTPIRKGRLTPRSLAVPSPVVSISSPSSAPNTPERIKQLSQDQRRALVAIDLEWTPQPNGQITSSRTAPVEENAADNTDAPTVVVGQSRAIKRARPQKRKPGKIRSKGVAQALFMNDDAETNQESEHGTNNGTKRPAEVQLNEPPLKKLAGPVNETVLDAPITVEEGADDLECTDMEDEQYEPETLFDLTPLSADGNSLLAASIYQYSTDASPCSVESARTFNQAEVELMMRFSSQLERLKTSYTIDRDRVLRQFTRVECTCGSSKKKPAATSSKLNWKKQLWGEASKKKHMKRRQKKQLAAKLKDLFVSYEGKLDDIRLIQRLEVQAFTARQEFQLLAAQL